jgi:ABC-type polysaccharide/polyol phosphate export permease
MFASLRAAWRYRDLVRNLVARDLRIKYKGSSLGFAWSLVHPIVLAGVYTLAFTFILDVRVPHFTAFVLSGLLPWNCFATTLLQATGSVADSSSLVRKVAFPRIILPLGSVVSQFTQFAMMYAVIVPIAAALGPGLSPALVALVPLLLLQFAFTMGLALLTSTAFVYFRDTGHLVEVALQIWFWLTPIVYAVALVPQAWRRLFWLNPMAGFVTAYQRIVIEGSWPSPVVTASLAAVALITSAAGLVVFARHQRRFAEMV